MADENQPRRAKAPSRQIGENTIESYSYTILLGNTKKDFPVLRTLPLYLNDHLTMIQGKYISAFYTTPV